MLNLSSLGKSLPVFESLFIITAYFVESVQFAKRRSFANSQTLRTVPIETIGLVVLLSRMNFAVDAVRPFNCMRSQLVSDRF